MRARVGAAISGASVPNLWMRRNGGVKNVVDLLADHEKAYLERCRKYALQAA